MKKALILAAALLLGQAFIAQPAYVAAGSSVYICTGSNAKKYHSSRSCRGLGNCEHRIKAVTVGEAVRLGRTPCKICCK